MKINLIDLKEQYNKIKEDTEMEVLNVLSACNYINGENVKNFEKEFADYLGVKHAISVANGTDALVIALRALGVGMGDEVITSTFTFFSTGEAIASVGAKPVFVDVDEKTYNIDVSKIEEKITVNTKAIIPVHIFGQVCDIEKIIEIAGRHDIKVIEDACQAIGAEYNGKKAGSFGDLGCFSFYPTKNLGCAGDGGMIVTNDDDLAVIARALKGHGSGENGEKAFKIINANMDKYMDFYNKSDAQSNINNETIYNPLKYYNYLIGYNSRLDEVQAAILRIKLKHIDEWNKSRVDIATYYNEKLKSQKDIVTPFNNEETGHVYHLYIIQSEKREELISYLQENGISTGIYYPVPLHLQKAFIYLGYKNGDLPVSEYLSKRTLAIPMYPELEKEKQEFIIENIQKLIRK